MKQFSVKKFGFSGIFPPQAALFISKSPFSKQKDVYKRQVLAQLLGIQRKIIPRGVPPFRAGIVVVIGRPALVLPADVAGNLMRAPRQGRGGHPRHAGLQRRVDKQPQQPDVGLIYQQVVGAASQNNAVVRGGQFLDEDVYKRQA